MLEFIFLSQNSFYLIAIIVVAVLFIIEILGHLFGLSLGQLLDSDSDVEVTDGTGGINILSFLGLGAVPTLVWLIGLLTTFSIFGFVLNWSTSTLFTFFLSKIVGTPLVLLISFYINAKLCRVLARIVPKSESSAVSKDTFSGRLANITLGTAKKGKPAEAVVKDEYNQKHYVMVEPIDEEELHQGDDIVLVVKEQSYWLAAKFE